MNFYESAFWYTAYMKELVKLVVFVPEKDADEVREALGKAGAGRIGEYSFCSFSLKGVGRFKPSDNANPHIGTANQLEAVSEERIEVACEKHQAADIIQVIKDVHPYEEVVIDIYPMLSL
ncbi:MAG: hypothetical protein JWM37_743 [Candidatus Saccharibacteria bacterium]|nr:hypothetical protein [Candidatus Saccharibacteria bacterium]